MRTVSGIASPARDVRPAGRVLWRGLAGALFGSDPPGGRWRSPGQRWAARAVLGAAVVLLCWASVASLDGGHFLGTQWDLRNGQFDLQTPFFSTSIQWSGFIPPGLGTYPPLMQVVTIVWVVVALVVVLALPLAVRRPLLAWRIGWLGLLTVPLLHMSWWGGLPWDPVQVLVVLAMLGAAGIRHDRPVMFWLWLLTLVPWWFWIVHDGLSVVTAALGSVAFLAMAVAVDSVGSRQRAQVALADQAEAAEVERARRAVLEERARIARELHDVVAHHMSLMAIRAESAPHRMGALPDPVRAEFGALSEAAREALADMRRLLGVLHSDQPAARAPQPGLPDLPGLVETARQAGMTVELSTSPASGRVPPSAGVCAYRIIQEALSNAGRHAAGAPVTVSVHQDADTVTLQVTNGPGVQTGSHANGHRPGHGLAGMRERAGLLGGSLSAGPAADGGFEVSAVLPLSGSAV